MGFTTQTLTARFQQAKEIKITNAAAATASTEYSHALQDKLKVLIVKSRTTSTLKIAFIATQSGTNYVTIPKGAVLELQNLDWESKTMYFQSNQNSDTIEIVELY